MEVQTNESPSVPEESKAVADSNNAAPIVATEAVPMECDEDVKSPKLEENTLISPEPALPAEQIKPQTPVMGIKKKRKKAKKIKRGDNYPKFYRNAYVRYCEEARGKVCEENPTLDPVEVTKLVAANWLSLEKELKQPYLKEAQLDKDRYEKELKEFQALNPTAEEDEPKKKKMKTGDMPNTVSDPDPRVPTTSAPQKISNESLPSTSATGANEIPKAFLTSNCELPIFTDAFLEHNKIIEAELKTLRRCFCETEQQNSVLMKHIENMENGVRKVEGEVANVRQRNSQLESYLTKLRAKLASSFQSISLPVAGIKQGATVENVDKYFLELASETRKQHSSPPAFLNKARDILKKLDLKVL